MRVSAKTVFNHPVHFLAFGFGSGLAPKAPGTFGTIAVLPFYWLIADFSVWSYGLVCAVVCILGVYLCGRSASLLNTHDHPGIVWDEFAGMLITLIAIPPSGTNIILAFILFRLFDIFKPWPIKWVDQKVSGGFGIMLDDILAGCFAWAILFGVNVLWL
ncbi:phosphatidylglycerophosphatase A family protein [Aliikangiella sp. IMCC44653]